MATYYIDPVNGNDANDGLGWWKIAYASGTGPQPVAGETVTGAGGATAKVLSVTGTWATSGTLYLYNRNATAFANGEAITFSGGGACVNAQGTPYDAVVSSFKTLKKTGGFAAGDVINLIKSVETALAGTVTATKGSVSVATTNDLTATAPVYSFIRINNDSTIYMVKTITSSVITLYRPYRGTGGSGYGITSLAAAVVASGDFTPTGGTGTAASPITLQAGMSSANLTQDGFTVLNVNTGSYGFSSTGRTFWNSSRLGFYYCTYPWGYTGTNSDCNLTDCFAFRCTATANGCTWVRATINNWVFETTPFNYTSLLSCIINGLETANPSAAGFTLSGGTNHYNTVINQWKNAGYAGQYAFVTSTFAMLSQLRLVDPIFDELASGCTMVRINAAGAFFNGLIFQNPAIGAGTLVDASAYGYFGDLSFETINGDYTDNRKYSGFGETGKYHLLAYDASVYNTAAPSAKITAVGPPTYPAIIRHYIPCDAGVAKTVSVYFRKSSSPAYGSANLPTMRLRWMTGTAPNLVSNVHDVAMAATDDSFVQVSYAVTPSIKGVIIMELIFLAGTNNALAWYDDIGVA